MSSPRKQRRAVTRWQTNTRQWATETARSLALVLYQDADPPVTPYNVGVVLDPGEKPWVQLPASCSLDRPLPELPGAPPRSTITNWLVTNCRIVGRFSDSSLHGWRWEWIMGCLINLSPASEHIQLDSRRPEYGATIGWNGPAIAPLAVAAVYHLYGAAALIDHPALAPLRRTGRSVQFAKDSNRSARLRRRQAARLDGR